MDLTAHRLDAPFRLHKSGYSGSFRLKTATATFTLRPLEASPEVYLTQVTPRELPGIFKNSGLSTFGWFEVRRLPARNAVRRKRDCGPLAGNGVLMWDKVPAEERSRCFDYLEKLIRNEIPRLPISSPPPE